VEQRRRVTRQGACWSGRYKVEGRRRSDWRECLVVDVSRLGVGLVLDGSIPRDLVSEEILVELHLPGTTVMVRLRGEVRHAAHNVRGGARIGMEFVELSEVERSVLDVLESVPVG
jgi:c-di-GMP-binding flagellar brake protein YcgR